MRGSPSSTPIHIAVRTLGVGDRHDVGDGIVDHLQLANDEGRCQTLLTILVRVRDDLVAGGSGGGRGGWADDGVSASRLVTNSTARSPSFERVMKDLSIHSNGRSIPARMAGLLTEGSPNLSNLYVRLRRSAVPDIPIAPLDRTHRQNADLCVSRWKR
jgi:hypothetical protein